MNEKFKSILYIIIFLCIGIIIGGVGVGIWGYYYTESRIDKCNELIKKANESLLNVTNELVKSENTNKALKGRIDNSIIITDRIDTLNGNSEAGIGEIIENITRLQEYFEGIKNTK
ncbi:MAG: hypothetical protein WC389_03675 [Lutibacter sp.]|jgi:CO dehydrogenase/acetyl-CoA synthase epsilon subunit